MGAQSVRIHPRILPCAGFLSDGPPAWLTRIKGGKITVMGVLETRSVDFDMVIIVDFDEKMFQKRAIKICF
jgi:hypothetical protein